MTGLIIVFIVSQLIVGIWLICLSYRISELEISENRVYIGGTPFMTREVLIAIMRHLKIRAKRSKESVTVTKKEV